MEWSAFLLGILDKLEKEWEVIKQIPITISIIFVFSVIIAYLLSRWRYRGIINILKSKINIELPTKDTEINHLKDTISKFIEGEKEKECQQSLKQILNSMERIKKDDT